METIGCLFNIRLAQSVSAFPCPVFDPNWFQIFCFVLGVLFILLKRDTLFVVVSGVHVHEGDCYSMAYKS